MTIPLLFEQGNAKALVDILLSLANSSELKMNIVKACQKRALEFDIQKMVRAYIALYNSLIK